MAEADRPTVELILWDGSRWTIQNWGHLRRWVREIEDFWRPFQSATISSDPVNARGNMINRLDMLESVMRSGGGAGQRLDDYLPQILAPLNESWGPFHPRSDNGRVVADVLEQFGYEAALWAFAFLRRHVQPQQAQTVEQFQGMMAAAAPAFTALEPSRQRLAAERTRFKNELHDLVQRLEDAESERIHQFKSLMDSSTVGMVGWARRRGKAWRNAMGRWRSEKEAVVSSITSTEQAYKELMALKAPVDYWNSKAAKHKTEEDKAANRVRWFFIVSIPVMISMFGFTGWYMLTQIQEAPQPGFYFVASAGLATTAGLMLWVGRLLTKLYLSQHHLRQDAEERAIMTTTYLALTADQAASEPDRAIILNALFRATSDGIVKEDGGLDPNLASALSRALAR